ncbi:nitrate- and nitrite sensing domain-containing protein [Saccharopolyspora griseoalba]|uniref:histidine kinase n=1 Tax=Saccharopolyspora griseoalba TaxID=1431848 RepID=A0ABW2LJH2_9PSEU
MSGDKAGASKLQWRNWSLLTKLAAVVLVPVIFAITLGVGQIRWQVEQADDYGRVATVLDTEHRIQPLTEGLQLERNRAVELLAGDGDAAAFEQQTAETDKAAQDLRQAMNANRDLFTDVATERYDEVRKAMDTVDKLRKGAAVGAVDMTAVVGGYSQVIQQALSLDRALTASVADPRISSTATALQDLLALSEEVRLQQALVLTGLSEGELDEQTLQQLNGSRARLLSKINDARSGVAEHWQNRLDDQLKVPSIVQRNAMLAQLVAESTDDVHSGSYSIDRQAWNEASDGSVATIEGGRGELAHEVRTIADELADDASDSAGWDSVFLLAALIAAAAMIIMISRQLLGSLRALRIGALDAAEYDLPQAVAQVREGKGASAEVPPLPVDTSEEVGQVARAFDQVNEQALRLAVEQADLRRGYSDAFVSVSRRSQALLERQLRLFEELEQDEEDPDQLSRLFQLDHLATRMRRNNENLMVLSGSDLARRFTQPTEVADVLRAAVSEIEQYPRVMVQPPPAIKLRGNTASDLVRLVAELLDNAANFSAPDTSVTVSAYQSGDGTLVLDVLDQGIGMGNEELFEANQRLSQVSEDDMATSRRMGLFVAGRLAQRHGINVELHGGPDVEGVRAAVLIPSDHVVSAQGQQPQMPSAAQPAQRNGHSHQHNDAMLTSGGLPRREGRQSIPPQDSGWQTRGPQFAAQPTGQPQQDQQSPEPASLFEPAQPSDNPPEPPPGLFGEGAESTDFFSPSGGEVADSGAEATGFFNPSGFAEAETAQHPNGLLGDLDPDDGWPASAEPQDAEPPAPEPPRNDLATQWFMPASESAAAQTGEFSWPDDDDPLGAPTGSDAEPEETPLTASGLPQRKPRRAAPQDPAGSEPGPTSPPSGADALAGNGARSPEDISDQLAHNGIRFGDSEIADEGASGWPSAAAAEAAAEPEPWIPQTPEAQAWDFAAEKAREVTESASNPSAEFTSAGLPRRTPKANLVPGSVSNGDEPQQPQRRFQRDADALRSRLSDFQGGISRGRHRMDGE